MYFGLALSVHVLALVPYFTVAPTAVPVKLTFIPYAFPSYVPVCPLADTPVDIVKSTIPVIFIVFFAVPPFDSVTLITIEPFFVTSASYVFVPV